MGYKDPEKQREYQRQWRDQRRREWLAVNGPCRHCGSNVDPEVDHIDRNQKVDHKVWSWSKQRRDAELAKCQVLCRACHLKKGRAAGDVPPAAEHGKYMYEHRGCRCDVCRAGHTRYQVQWRRSRRAAG